MAYMNKNESDLDKIIPGLSETARRLESITATAVITFLVLIYGLSITARRLSS